MKKKLAPDQQTFTEINGIVKLKSLTDNQKRILALVNCHLTQAEIAKKLKFSPSYVCQTIKKLQTCNLIKKLETQRTKSGTREYNNFYELSQELAGIAKKEIEIIFTPYRAHHFIRKFRIISQTALVKIDPRTGYQKSKHMRGGDRYVFWYPGKSGFPSVTIEVHPKTILAYINKGQKIPAISAEEAMQRGWQAIFQAREKFIEKQQLFGIALDIETIGTQIGKCHLGLTGTDQGPMAPIKFEQDKIPQEKVMAREHPVWFDGSVEKELGPGHIEMEMFEDNPYLYPAEQTIKTIAEIKSVIPVAMKEITEKLGPMNDNIIRVQAMMQGGITISQQYEQMVNFMTKALDEMAAIRKENAELKAKLELK